MPINIFMNKKIYELLKYTKTSNSQYKGKRWETGYHTISIDGVTYEGQRKPAERLKDIPYDFSNKSVLDIGCNQGGMLFQLKDTILNGVGVDYDYKLINCANKIKSYQNLNNINFFVHDIDKDLLENLIYYNNTDHYDVVFLLSVCMWIEKWRELIKWVYENSDVCLFETNGTESQQFDQKNELLKYYKNIITIRTQSDDDVSQKRRELLLCLK
jgi:SAM-dependent methyltransferase